MQEQPAPIEDAFVMVRGARVHYLRAGVGKPILLIHGIAGSSNNWRRNIEALAKDATVYAIDLLNMGRSERIAGLDASLEATADQVAATMDALGLERADIAGHSHGGAVAMMFAARYPARVRSLILFAPVNPYSRVRDGLIRAYNTRLGNRMIGAAPNFPKWLQLWALRRMYGDPARIVEGCLEGYLDGLKVPGTVPHIRAILRGWFTDMTRLEPLLPRIAEIPIMMVWGDRDCAVDPNSATELRRVLRRSELHLVAGGGHIVFEELPEEANRLMREWLRRGTAVAERDDATMHSRPVQPVTQPTDALIQHLSHGT